MKPTSLITRYVGRRVNDTSTADSERELAALKRKNAALEQQRRQEQERAAKNAASQEATIKGLREELATTKRGASDLEQELAAKNERVQQLEERVQGLEAQAAQEVGSRETVTLGLQHRIELAQKDVSNLNDQLVMHKGQIQSLERDKENLQKQLELVTLRLPAPKEGFWARTFGRRKELQDSVKVQ
ncbi:MAG: hypothetical protein ACXV4C_09115 [Halobacteriota archaeon]